MMISQWGLTACAACVWAGVDNAWVQEKLKARKMQYTPSVARYTNLASRTIGALNCIARYCGRVTRVKNTGIAAS